MATYLHHYEKIYDYNSYNIIKVIMLRCINIYICVHNDHILCINHNIFIFKENYYIEFKVIHLYIYISIIIITIKCILLSKKKKEKYIYINIYIYVCVRSVLVLFIDAFHIFIIYTYI